MYSVQTLAKMYKCTRNTIYTKLEHQDIKQFIIKDNKGLKLLPEGLNMLNVLFGESKVTHENQQINTPLNNKETSENEYIDKYVKALESQIDELKLDKEKLFNELTEQRKVLQLYAGEVVENKWWKKFFK